MTVQDTLKSLHLKTTPCRTEVLKLFLENEQALSHAFIESHTKHNFDRVTVYRTLKSFEEKGLIHKVLDDNSITKYALCQECSAEEHHHEHVHFKCKKCEQTFCIESVEIPSIKLPSGFKEEEKSLLIQGICEDCAKIS